MDTSQPTAPSTTGAERAPVTPMHTSQPTAPSTTSAESSGKPSETIAPSATSVEHAPVTPMDMSQPAPAPSTTGAESSGKPSETIASLDDRAAQSDSEEDCIVGKKTPQGTAGSQREASASDSGSCDVSG
jgi:hypothetical protein